MFHSLLVHDVFWSKERNNFLSRFLCFLEKDCILVELFGYLENMFLYLRQKQTHKVMAILNIRNPKTLSLVDRYLSYGYVLTGITIHRVRSLRSTPREGAITFSENSLGDHIVEIVSTESFSSDCRYYAVIRLLEPVDLPF